MLTISVTPVFFTKAVSSASLQRDNHLRVNGLGAGKKLLFLKVSTFSP